MSKQTVNNTGKQNYPYRKEIEFKPDKCVQYIDTNKRKYKKERNPFHHPSRIDKTEKNTLKANKKNELHNPDDKYQYVHFIRLYSTL